MNTTLPLFWDLASLDPEKRLSAAQALCASLNNFQAEHKPTTQFQTEPRTEPQTESQTVPSLLDDLCAPDVLYALKRLIRGLPSSREGARQGFALALTEVLSSLDFLTVNSILDLIFQYTEISGGMKGQEERDMLFGRVFGFTSLLSSGALSRPHTSLADFQRLVQAALDCAGNKSYLREACYGVVVSSLDYINGHSYKDEAADWILSKVLEAEIQTPDELLFVIVYKKTFPQKDLSSVLPSWKHGLPLHQLNLTQLARVLRESSSAENPLSGSSSWSPRLHGVWDAILEIILTPNESKLTGKTTKKNKVKSETTASEHASFQDFWRVVVDDSLFRPDATHERKFWGFQLFERLLPRLAESEMPLLFTPNFMRTLINNLASSDRFLNKAAQHTVGIIISIAETSKRVGFALLTQLAGKDGSRQFDRLTKTKTVETLLSSMDAAGIEQYTDYLMKAFLEQEMAEDNKESERNVTAHRKWAIDQLFLLTRNAKISRGESWFVRMLSFFLTHGFFDIIKENSVTGPKPSPALSEQTRAVCQTRFYALLGDLSTLPPATDANTLTKISRRALGTASDGEFWAYKACMMVKDFENKHRKAMHLHHEMPEETRIVRDKALATMENIRKMRKDIITDKNKKEIADNYRAFELLFLHSALQTLSDPEEAAEIIVEIISCYEKAFTSKAKPALTPKKLNKSEAKESCATECTESDIEEVEELEPFEVLIDILLSFLAKPSSLLRTMAEQVFQTLCGSMTQRGLTLLLGILDTKESVSGQAELFDEEEVEAMDSDDEENSSDEEESSDDEDEDEDEEEENDEKRRKKANAALDVDLDALMKDVKTKEEGSDDEDEELLGDEEMKPFDDKLAEIFKQKKIEKSGKKDAKLNVKHFKNKVLDLLEIFVRKQTQHPLILDLVMPILGFIRTNSANTSSKQVSEKATGLLKNRICRSNPTGYDEEHAWKILTDIHGLAKKAPNAQIGGLCSAASVFVSKVLLSTKSNEDEKTAKERRDRVAQIYSESLESFVSKKNSLFQPSLFLDMINRNPDVGWLLYEQIAKAVRPEHAANVFRQTQSFHLLEVLFKCSGAENRRDLLDAVPAVRDALLSTFQVAVQAESSGMTVQRLKEILKAGLTAARRYQKIDQTKGSNELWKPEEFGMILQTLVDDQRYQSHVVRNQSQQFLKLIHSKTELTPLAKSNTLKRKKTGKKTNAQKRVKL